MKNFSKIGFLAMVLIALNMQSCVERIDAGHVGIKINLYGDNKGVDDVTECTGLMFYSPLSTNVEEFAIYVQHKEYKDDTLMVNSKDGSLFKAYPSVNYQIKPEKVIDIYKKFRLTLSDLEDKFLKVAIYEAFRECANLYNADQLISNRSDFDEKVRAAIDKKLLKEGFILKQFTFSLIYPNSLLKAIEAKNNSVQLALQTENGIRTAEAEAKKAIAKAHGQAESILEMARANAEANRLQKQELTKELLEQQWIDAWKSGGAQVPQYISGSASDKFIFNAK